MAVLQDLFVHEDRAGGFGGEHHRVAGAAVHQNSRATGDNDLQLAVEGVVFELVYDDPLEVSPHVPDHVQDEVMGEWAGHFVAVDGRFEGFAFELADVDGKLAPLSVLFSEDHGAPVVAAADLGHFHFDDHGTDSLMGGTLGASGNSRPRGTGV